MKLAEKLFPKLRCIDLELQKVFFTMVAALHEKKSGIAFLH